MIFKEEIIQLIIQIRKNKKISQERLGRGICSEQQISKLEKGELPSDFFLLEMLMQRLGKNVEKLEIILSEEEFSEIKERDDIIDALRCGDRKLAVETGN